MGPIPTKIPTSSSDQYALVMQLWRNIEPEDINPVAEFTRRIDLIWMRAAMVVSLHDNPSLQKNEDFVRVWQTYMPPLYKEKIFDRST